MSKITKRIYWKLNNEIFVKTLYEIVRLKRKLKKKSQKRVLID